MREGCDIRALGPEFVVQGRIPINKHSALQHVNGRNSRAHQNKKDELVDDARGNMTDKRQRSRTRRAAIGGIGAGLAGAALAATTTPVLAQAGRKIFVLVHGSSAGGWCYRRVADLLERGGHKVFTPTFTGLGERSHLMSGMITLDTHIADVVNVIRWESLESVVLVGHSYGGWIISGVAEQVETKIASIVFLDAFMPENGQRVLDTNSPRSRAEIEEATRS
jgi:alpha-beta hydrolase superfamily lysophospholipase